jgi:hypothetical protein
MNFFKKFFTKKKEVNTITTPLLEYDDSHIEKWYPDDALFRTYHNFTAEIGRLDTLKRQITKFENTRLTIINDITNVKEKISEADGIDILNEVNLTELEQELYKVEFDIKRSNNAYKELNDKNTIILQEWKEYLKKANDFLLKYDISHILNVNDILSTNNVYVNMKKQYDGCVVSLNNDVYLENFAQILLLFDFNKIKDNFSLDYFNNQKLLEKKCELLKKLDSSELFKSSYTDNLPELEGNIPLLKEK